MGTPDGRTQFARACKAQHGTEKKRRVLLDLAIRFCKMESSTQRPIHHRILLYLFARADYLCMSLFASLFPAIHS